MIDMLTDTGLAALPGLRHGFFTRRGGVSGGIYASLNCGLGSGDAPACVVENRHRVAARLAVPADRLVTCRQMHSPRVVSVEEPWALDAAPEADALVTDVPHLALGILTADCAPILLADREAGVIGAAHAGWRGAAAGVIAATVGAMAALGAAPGRIVAAIGPAIRQPSYEVGPEFPEHFPNDGDAFAPAERDGHFLFDLPRVVARRLRAAGVTRVGDLRRDTLAEPEMFFSNRRAVKQGESDYGRLVSVIVLGTQG